MGIRVYIAGPYTLPDPIKNTHNAIEVANRLAHEGLVPYIPHLNTFWHYHSPKPYLWWLEYDIQWLDVCDVVLRIPGPSTGADKEIDHAVVVGKPVFYDVETLLLWAKSCASSRP